MHVNLTPQLDSYVAQKVASGDYNNASEVIREALRLLKERDQLKAAIDRGMNSGDFEPHDMQEIKRQARAQWEAEHATSQP
jgi:antitoxin ParD1/3/4